MGTSLDRDEWSKATAASATIRLKGSDIAADNEPTKTSRKTWMSNKRLEANVLESLQSGEKLCGLISAVKGPWYPTLGLLLAATAAGVMGYNWLVTVLLLAGALTASRTRAMALALTDNALYVFRSRRWRKVERLEVLPLSSTPVKLDKLSVTLEGTRYWIAPRYLCNAATFGDYLATAAPAA